MDQLNDAVDKLFTEVDHLDRILGVDAYSEERVDLAVAVAKRVRRASQAVVQELAKMRDA